MHTLPKTMSKNFSEEMEVTFAVKRTSDWKTDAEETSKGMWKWIIGFKSCWEYVKQTKRKKTLMHIAQEKWTQYTRKQQ